MGKNSRLLLPAERLRDWCGNMVSVDHFVYELRRQLNDAADQGASEIVVTSHNLARSVRSGTAWLDACCEAMHQEVRDGDVIIQKGSGVGFTVIYCLPRA